MIATAEKTIAETMKQDADRANLAVRRFIAGWTFMEKPPGIIKATLRAISDVGRKVCITNGLGSESSL